MASYMNPKGLMTDVLSKYLEFDPKTLEFAILSGNISLRDVNLREEAIYPHLNKWINQQKSTKLKDRIKPPLHMKIVKGTIGELDMKIPWTSLAWRQGDVQVDVRNIVITVALESREETRKRKGDVPAWEEADSEKTKDQPDGGGGGRGEEGAVQFDRDVKQRMIKEAEKRLLSGRKVTGWLRKTYKEESEKRQKAMLSRDNLVKSESSMAKWLKGATTGFRWRFYAGLQMKIENLKIVIVQDGVEVGVIMPNIQLLAGDPDKRGHKGQGAKEENATVGSNTTPPRDGIYESGYEDGEHVDKWVVYKGIGVYVRKIPTMGMGGDRESLTDFDVPTKEFIIRPFDFEFSYSLFFPYPPEKRKKRKPALKSPVDDVLSASGSQSTSASKKRRGKRDKVEVVEANEPKAGASTAKTETTAASTLPVPAVPHPQTVERVKTQESLSMVKRAVRRASIQQTSYQQVHAPPQNDNPSRSDIQSNMSGTAELPAIQAPPPLAKKRHARRSSLAAPLMGSETVASKATTVSNLPNPKKVTRQTSAPLALPEEIKQKFEAATEQEDLTTRFDSRLRVSAIKVVLSTTQYHMLDLFLASASRMRNGRPSQTIKNAIPRPHQAVFYNAAKKKISGDGSTDSQIDVSVDSKLELLSNRSATQRAAGVTSASLFRSQIIKSWWQYAFGAVLWELRQQKRLRRLFQDAFLSFSWERQKHRRDEYVALYIQTRLGSDTANESASSASNSTDDTKLAEIEDELLVEQVLLYRNIARTAYSQGMTRMPASIIEIGARSGKSRLRRQLQQFGPGSSSGDPLLPRSPGKGGFELQPWVNMPVVLSVAGQRCEVSRKRLSTDHAEILPQGGPFAKFYPMSRRRGVEESTVGMTVDTRATKGTRKARGNQTTDDQTSSSMKFSFSATFLKFEFLLIEDEKVHESDLHSNVSSVTGSDEHHSEMSSVTIEPHDESSDDGMSIPEKIEDASTGRVLNSTDFLLFREPETTLLQLVLTELGCSALGQSGGSRNLNLKVRSVEGTGYDGCTLLSVGPKADDDTASVADMAVSGEPQENAFYGETSDALSFSLVVQDEERSVQCDSAHISACADIDGLSRILKFPLSSPAMYPSQVLPRSGREEVLLHVLNQNDATSSFVFVDASIRIKGVDIVFPNVKEWKDSRKENMEQSMEMEVDYGYDNESWGSGLKSVETKKGEEGARFRIDMIEFYSGSTASALTGGFGQRSTTGKKTRKLKMLDLEMFEEGNSSLLSYDWIVAVGGVDFEVLHIGIAGETPRPISFLDAPVQAEVFGTTNAGSMRDFTRAKREVIVEVSPVDFKVSEKRLQLLSKAVPEEALVHSSQVATDASYRPRLDVLSRSLLYVVDLSFERVRLSLVTDEGMGGMGVASNYSQFETFLWDFLNVVKNFDLRYPNGEALSAGMQICIDRLAGIGFGTEDGWECANKALLHFLEDMRIAQEAGELESDDAAEKLVHSAISKTSDDYKYQLSQPYSRSGGVQHHMVFDMPNGFAVSCVKLYYDFHCMLNIPSAFITNGDGIHIMRLTPEVGEDEGDDLHADLDDADSDALLSNGAAFKPPPAAANVRLFSIDADSLFGKGGQSLTILGGDESQKRRPVESLVDVELGDLEILFCQDVFEDLLETFADFVPPLIACIPKVQKRASKNTVATQSDQRRTLLSVTAFSALFSSDGFTPFCRLIFNDCIWTEGYRQEQHSRGAMGSAKSLSLLNLTSEGQLHPEPISLLSGSLGLPFLVEITNVNEQSQVQLNFHALRIVFLRQFLNESLQFFYYSDYGVGLFRARMKDILKQANGRESRVSATRIVLHFHDCSVIIPRHSESSDMVAIEVRKVSVGTCRPNRSFDMPTQTQKLDVGPLPFKNSSEEEEFCDPSSITCSRTFVSLTGFRIYTSTPALGGKNAAASIEESPAFGFFFGIDGRATKDKPVYEKLDSLGPEAAEDEAKWLNSEKARRVWQEATCNSVSLDIIVDYAPYMRLLISDPLDSPPNENRVALDVTLSQFCLLLTVWYGNMQQLPVLFPYNSKTFEMNSRSLAVLEKFPFYGTSELLDILKTTPEIVSETAISFSNMLFCCREDHSPKNGGPSVTLAFEGATIHIISDSSGITRLGAGSLSCSMMDTSKTFHQVVTVVDNSSRTFSFADHAYGVNEDVGHLSNDFPQGFQLSILMGPEWSVYNLGMQCPDLVMADFSTIFRFLDFVTVYFADESYGNPSFEAIQRAAKIKEELLHAKSGSKNDIEDPISIIDFRCWLRKPRLKIPCTASDSNSDFTVVASNEGLWYRFAGGDTFSSQEVVGREMILSYENQLIKDSNMKAKSGGTLIEGLSFGLRINYHGEANHYDVSLKIPHEETTACNFTDPGVFVDPGIVRRPTVCVPHKIPRRFLGPQICEMTCLIDVLPDAWSALYGLFNADVETIEESSTSESSVGVESEGDSSESQETSSLSFTGNLGDLRIFVLDPILGPHLPVALINLSETRLTTSSFGMPDEENFTPRGQAPLHDLQVFLEGSLWADYFKFGLTRSWEPLLEAYSFSLLFEKSKYRGVGLTLSSEVPFHVNISGGFLSIIDDCYDTFSSIVNNISESDKANQRSSSRTRSPKDEIEEFKIERAIHRRPTTLRDADRVAFSLKNVTGQMIRTYRIGGSISTADSESIIVNYLDNAEAIELSLLPSVSLVKNLGVVEVQYPGLENSPRSPLTDEIGESHQLDLQIPGFAWIRNLKIDQFGRRFIDLVPRCSSLRSKVREDWRLGNIMKVLVEVGLERGGREVSIRSLFSIHNMTTHELRIRLNALSSNPDPSEERDEDLLIGTSESLPIPIVLLENALRKPGSHLGSFWLRPEMESLDEVFTSQNLEMKDVSIKLSTKPVQLARVAGESSDIFSSVKGENSVLANARSGVTLSCPVVGNSDEREVAPFCYALEIVRSPLIPMIQQAGISRKARNEKQHGPVAYTINVHAPIVLVNMLPERGRFEIMHAVRRNVLWFADLEPGQEVAVHSVGLDAPLMLFINLSFCRTPVGGGALIHHGSEMSAENREHLVGLKSIGKAGKAVTKQLGKTITSLGDSPDKRITQKSQINKDIGSVVTRVAPPGDDPNPLGMDSATTFQSDVGGQTFRVDTVAFLPSDCVSETIVVDRVGQKATLQIENIRGGGGQRRISVSSPYWIVNCTEHSLRYKQENSNLFVCGTVTDPDRDGSLPIGGASGGIETSRSIPSIDQSTERGTIFAGTPGALATSFGRCALAPDEVAAIIDKNFPLDQMARLAFMFNFSEGSLSMGGQKLCLQLHDGTAQTKYQSDWSRGFSLASVGFSQVVEMQCAEGRSLELIVVVQTAPGVLSGYTKIVRILPRYIAVNHLPYPVRLWQDNSSFRPPTADAISSSENTGSARWKLSTSKAAKNDPKKVNQYENLWGREVNISIDEMGGHVPSGTSARESALYIATLSSKAWRPFNVPDSRGDRQIRVGLGAAWNLSSSISADIPGENTLRVSRSTDIRLLKHVSTRTSPQYTLTLPEPGESSFDSELGVWFETEWGSDRSLLVKAVKKGSYCFNKTDLRAGDELLAIDGIPVSRMSFVDAMNLLKSRLSDIKTFSQNEKKPSVKRSLIFSNKSARQLQEPEPIVDDALTGARPLVLTFRTSEERLRRVRRKAAKSSSRGVEGQSHAQNENQIDQFNDDSRFLSVELRPIHNMQFLHLREAVTVPYEIQNRSKSTTIYFRQRGCSAHPWRSLKPGASEVYTWEEPLKSKRLSLRVDISNNFAFAFDVDEETSSRALSRSGTGEDKPSSSSTLARHRKDSRVSKGVRKLLNERKVKDEEDSAFSQSVNIRLDEIGYQDFLYLNGPTDPSTGLHMEVGVVGATRVLAVQDIAKDGDNNMFLYHLEALEARESEEEMRLGELRSISMAYKASIGNPSASMAPAGDLAGQAKIIMKDFPEEGTISGKHQLVVDVLEAIGLSPDNLIGVCNPYVEVALVSHRTSKSLFRRATGVRKTYFVRKSLNPSWKNQSFVFDVPEEAVSVTRGHALRIKVRNFRKVGAHTTLGRAQVDLNSVRDQKPMTGWFPLVGKTGRRELESSNSHWGRGSIRLNVHWVFTTSALLDYFVLLSETRLSIIRESIEGLKAQLERKREEELKQMERSDGFEAVRLNDSVHNGRRSASILEPRESGKRDSNIRRLIMQPVRSLARQSIALVSDVAQMKRSSGKELPPAALLYGGKKQPNDRSSKQESGVQLESRIVKTRHEFPEGLLHQMQDRKREMELRNYAELGTFPLTSFKSWVDAQKLVNDKDLIVQIKNDVMDIDLNVRSRRAQITGKARAVEDKPRVDSLVIPPLISLAAHSTSADYSEMFWQSRKSFERFSRCALRVALNPGGWLTIRPIQAKNLPGGSSGVSVKVQYDMKSLSSDTVDATVFPTWFKRRSSDTDSPRADATEYLPGDLHFKIPPQRTNGYLRLSVNSEGRHQGIITKTDLGVLHIPLGNAIAASVNALEDYLDEGKAQGEAESPIYIRWFPLKKPEDEVPAEGDQLIGRLPVDTEKVESDQFTEYFTPCVQLGLIWVPDVSRDDTLVAEGQVDDAKRPLRPGGVFSSQVKRYINADLSQISFALIDSQHSTELLACTFTDVDVRYWVTKAKSRYGTSIGWFQFDQQNESAREPVVLCPTQKDTLTPVLQMLAVKDNMRSKTEVATFDFIDISIAEFDLSIEERFLFQLYSFFTSLRLRAKTHKQEVQRTKSVTEVTGIDSESEEPSLFTVVSQLASNEQVDRRVYIQQLCLGVLKFNISYFKGKKDSKKIAETIEWTMSQARGVIAAQTTPEQIDSDAFRRWSQNTSSDEAVVDYLGKGGSSLPSVIASLFPNVSDAPVRLQSKSLNHVFYSPTEILVFIMGFYQTEILRQIYKIIGSLDFVGNPTMVLNSFISGFRDLIVTPSVALIDNPTDVSKVGIGVAKGALSLFSHSTSGFFGFASRVSAGAGQGLATISMDKKYRRWHRQAVVAEASNLNRAWKRRGLQNAGDMIVRPVADIASGITSGVAGLIVAPAKGMKRDGGRGFAKGVVSGVAGVIVKPTVGVLDALSHFTGSIHDIARSVNVLEKRVQPTVRYRLPYVFGSNKILTPYEAKTARATQLLKLFPPKKRRGIKVLTEYVVHVEVLSNLGVDTYGIVTNLRFILLRVKKEQSGSLVPSICWQVSLVGDSTISSELSEHGHNGVALTINVKKPFKANEAESVLMDDAGPVSVSVDEQIGLDDVSDIGGDLDHGHGSGRGKEGELLEWFTVVAEFQHRRQISRLHNAVSSMTGNLDAIIRDRPLGYPGCSQGYTSFGIFYFCKGTGGVDYQAMAPPNEFESLESIPWYDEYRTNGPEWLLEAQETAYHTETSDIDMMVQTPEEHIPTPNEGRNTARRLTRWLVGRLPTITDADNDARSYETPMQFVTTTSQQGSEDEMDLLDAGEELGDDQLVGQALSHSLVSQPDQEVGQGTSSADESSDFQSAISTESNMPTEPRRERRRGLRRFRRTSNESKDDTLSLESTTLLEGGKNGTGHVSGNSSVAATGNEEYPDGRSRLSQSRIERMEALMEQLMIFSTEQALQGSRASVGPSSLVMGPMDGGGGATVASSQETLQEEIRELRRQLREQSVRESSREQQSTIQITSLRSEIASLRNQLMMHHSGVGGGEGGGSSSSSFSQGNEEDEDEDEVSMTEDGYDSDVEAEEIMPPAPRHGFDESAVFEDAQMDHSDNNNT